MTSSKRFTKSLKMLLHWFKVNFIGHAQTWCSCLAALRKLVSSRSDLRGILADSGAKLLALSAS